MSDVKFRFVVEDHAKAMKALEDISTLIDKINSKGGVVGAQAVAQTKGGSGVRRASQEARRQKLEAQADRLVDRESRERAKAEKTVSRAHLDAARREAAQVKSGSERIVDFRRQLINTQIKDAHAEHRKAQAETKRSSAAARRADEKARKDQARAEAKASRQQEQAAKTRAQKIYGAASAAGAPLRIGFSALGRAGGIAGSGFGSLMQAMRIAGPAAGAAMGVAAAAAAGLLAAGVATQGGFQRSSELQDVVKDLQIQGRAKAGQGYESMGQLTKELRQTAVEMPGLKATDLAQAGQSFIAKTGRLDLFRSARKSIGQAMLATGASGEDVGNLAGILMDPSDWGLSPAEASDALATLAFQGRTGRVEFNQISSELPKIAAPGRMLGLGGKSGIKFAGALAQLAAIASPNAAQAGTGAQSFLFSLASKKGEDVISMMGGLQLKDFQDNGGEWFAQLIGSAIGRGMLDTKQVAKLNALRTMDDAALENMSQSDIEGVRGLSTMSGLFERRGLRVTAPLMAAFGQAQSRAFQQGGSEAVAREAGMQAVRDLFNKMAGENVSADELAKDAAQRGLTFSAAVDNMWEKISQVTDNANMTDSFAKMATSVGNLAQISLPLFAQTVADVSSVLGESIQGFVNRVSPTSDVKANVEGAGELTQKVGGQLEQYVRDDAGRLMYDMKGTESQRWAKAIVGTLADPTLAFADVSDDALSKLSPEAIKEMVGYYMSGNSETFQGKAKAVATYYAKNYSQSGADLAAFNALAASGRTVLGYHKDTGEPVMSVPGDPTKGSIMTPMGLGDVDLSSVDMTDASSKMTQPLTDALAEIKLPMADFGAGLDALTKKLNEVSVPNGLW